MPGILSAAELLSIQNDAAAAACDMTCTIQRKSLVSDGEGQASEVWNTINTTVCGMSQPTGTQLQNYDFLIGSLSTWQVKLPANTDVNHQDHLVIGGSETLIVQVLLQPSSYSSLTVVLASEID